MKQALIKQQSDVLFIRFDSRYIAALDREIAERGFNNRNEAVRQIVAAWLHKPDALPIGLPLKK